MGFTLVCPHLCHTPAHIPNTCVHVPYEYVCICMYPCAYSFTGVFARPEHMGFFCVLHGPWGHVNSGVKPLSRDWNWDLQASYLGMGSALRPCVQTRGPIFYF